ncbi:PHP domain-containing protein [Lentzea sp. NPDC058436]|uniref:PHP domain-containing protein n=1 Tax=Lentzea sp. NPDC058436 TaxID=3346499 RepID=UPI00364A06A0
MSEVARRRFLQGAGALGVAGALGTGRASASSRYQWLSGDHHTHTQYSYDGMYTVEQQIRGALRHGTDWLVVTDHGHASHEAHSVEATAADLRRAARKFPQLLLWHGMEWNVPGAEHATVFFEDCRDEAGVLRDFERQFDWRLNGQEASNPANERKALDAVRFLQAKIRNGTMKSALVFVNHPMRNGRVAPHELRALRDLAPDIVVGMEGAPGAQGDGDPLRGPGGHRGGYANNPGPNSYAPYPAEAYRTHGGFDWMTAKVGGVWDSLLTEGLGWWITSNSDSHFNSRDTIVRVPEPADQFDLTGKHLDPVEGAVPQVSPPYVDFFPCEFSRTVVGATRRTRGAVMEGLRAGRAWVSHGGLVEDLRFEVYASGRTETMGGRLRVRRGSDVTVLIKARLATRPNSAGFVPRLRRLDLIKGAVTGRSSSETLATPHVKVERSYEPRWHYAVFTHTFRDVGEPFFLRLRGTDGNRGAFGPQADAPGAANPWEDLWCYTNPIFVEVR